MPRSPTGVEIEASIDIEPTHLVLEVFVHNGSRGPIREVTIRPDVRRGDFVLGAAAKAIADLARDRWGRATFELRPKTGPRGAEGVELAGSVSFRDAEGARRRLAVPRLSLDLSLPSLDATRIAADSFADRASRAYSHRFELGAGTSPEETIRTASGALAALSLAPVEETFTSPGATVRASLFGVDGRGTGYMVRIVATPIAGGSRLRTTVFVESEAGLFSFYRKVREAVGVALGTQ